MVPLQRGEVWGYWVKECMKFYDAITIHFSKKIYNSVYSYQPYMKQPKFWIGQISKLAGQVYLA